MEKCLEELRRPTPKPEGELRPQVYRWGCRGLGSGETVYEAVRAPDPCLPHAAEDYGRTDRSRRQRVHDERAAAGGGISRGGQQRTQVRAPLWT